VPQDILLLPNKRVWENLTYAMRAVGHSRREVRRVVPQILERFDLLHRAGAFPSQLSGGEQQRVAIARAIINEPVLVLADEPTGHLDPDMSKSILQDFVEINKRGTTVVMATHDMATMQEFPARTITLEKGMIVADESHTQESTR
jgi:cell division transport system ATP-binding protein